MDAMTVNSAYMQALSNITVMETFIATPPEMSIRICYLFFEIYDTTHTHHLIT